MKINSIIASASLLLGQLFCCVGLSAIQERVDSVRETVVQQLTTRAAFDIGSGEVKIVVCDVDPKTNKIAKTWFSRFKPVGLRKDLASNIDGYLSQKIEQELIDTINAMKQEAGQFHPQKWVGGATSVFRTAKNGQEVLDRVQTATGVDIQLLPQVEEGKIGFATAVAASDLAPEDIIAWDSGSGSFQLSAMVDGQLEVYGAEFAIIPALEALFVQRNQLYSDISPNPVSNVEALQLIETIRSKLPPIAPWMSKNKKQVVSIGGGTESIFAIAKKVIGHSPFTKEEVLAAIHDLSGKSDEYLIQFFERPKRMVVGLCLLYTVMDHCGFEKLAHHPTNGSCEGLAITPHFWNDHYVDFFMCRHGETVWNENRLMENPKNPSGPKVKGPLIQGSSDTDLNPKGELQAVEAAEKINQTKLTFKRIVTSNLKRAAKTAHIIGQKIGLIPEEDKNFSACSWGDCEGGTKEYRSSTYAVDAFGNYRGSNPDWKTMPTKDRWSFNLIPGADSSNSVVERMKSAFSRIANESQDGDRILIVTHSENMKAFMLDCKHDIIENMRLNSKFEELIKFESPEIKNCSLHKVRYNRVTEEFSYLGSI